MGDNCNSFKNEKEQISIFQMSFQHSEMIIYFFSFHLLNLINLLVQKSILPSWNELYLVIVLFIHYFIIIILKNFILLIVVWIMNWSRAQVDDLSLIIMVSAGRWEQKDPVPTWVLQLMSAAWVTLGLFSCSMWPLILQ